MSPDSRAKRSIHNLRLTLRHGVLGLLVCTYLLVLLGRIPGRPLGVGLEIDWKFPELWAESFGWGERAAVLRRISVLGLQFLLGLTGVVTVWNVFYGIGRTLRPWWSRSGQVIEKSPVRKLEPLVPEERRPRRDQPDPLYDVEIHGEPRDPQEK